MASQPTTLLTSVSGGAGSISLQVPAQLRRLIADCKDAERRYPDYHGDRLFGDGGPALAWIRRRRFEDGTVWRIGDGDCVDITRNAEHIAEVDALERAGILFRQLTGEAEPIGRQLGIKFPAGADSGARLIGLWRDGDGSLKLGRGQIELGDSELGCVFLSLRRELERWLDTIELPTGDTENLPQKSTGGPLRGLVPEDQVRSARTGDANAISSSDPKPRTSAAEYNQRLQDMTRGWAKERRGKLRVEDIANGIGCGVGTVSGLPHYREHILPYTERGKRAGSVTIERRLGGADGVVVDHREEEVGSRLIAEEESTRRPDEGAYKSEDGEPLEYYSYGALDEDQDEYVRRRH